MVAKKEEISSGSLDPCTSRARILQVAGSAEGRRVLFEDETRSGTNGAGLWIGGGRGEWKPVTLRLEVAQVTVHQHVVVEAPHGNVPRGLVVS